MAQFQSLIQDTDAQLTTQFQPEAKNKLQLWQITPKVWQLFLLLLKMFKCKFQNTYKSILINIFNYILTYLMCQNMSSAFVFCSQISMFNNVWCPNMVSYYSKGWAALIFLHFMIFYLKSIEMPWPQCRRIRFEEEWKAEKAEPDLFFLIMRNWENSSVKLSCEAQKRTTLWKCSGLLMLTDVATCVAFQRLCAVSCLVLLCSWSLEERFL